MRTLGLILQSLGMLLLAAVIIVSFWLLSLGCDMGGTGCRSNPIISLFGFLTSPESLWLWIPGLSGASLAWLGSRLITLKTAMPHPTPLAPMPNPSPDSLALPPTGHNTRRNTTQ